MCHQTVRLVAEGFERAGIATVVVGTMRGSVRDLPRVLITKYDAGMNFGPVGEREEHEAISRKALELFDAREKTLVEHEARADAAR